MTSQTSGCDAGIWHGRGNPRLHPLDMQTETDVHGITYLPRPLLHGGTRKRAMQYTSVLTPTLQSRQRRGPLVHCPLRAVESWQDYCRLLCN